MDIDKLNDELKAYWNNYFATLPKEIDEQYALIEDPDLDKYFHYLADNGTLFLDYGCGDGYGLLKINQMAPEPIRGLGIDTSLAAINYANKLAHHFKADNLTFVQGNEELLEVYPEGMFDGIFCSNVLDVLPELTSDSIIWQLMRILKPGGLLLIKLNFFLTPELIKQLKMEEIGPDTYSINGVLRAHNLSSAAWIKKFSEVRFLEEGAYHRVAGYPADRLLLFVK